MHKPQIWPHAITISQQTRPVWETICSSKRKWFCWKEYNWNVITQWERHKQILSCCQEINDKINEKPRLVHFVDIDLHNTICHNQENKYPKLNWKIFIVYLFSGNFIIVRNILANGFMKNETWKRLKGIHQAKDQSLSSISIL